MDRIDSTEESRGPTGTPVGCRRSRSAAGRDQAAATEAAGRTAIASKYVEHRERAQAALQTMFAAIEAMQAQAEEAREHDRLAAKAAARLGFPADERSGVAFGRQLTYLKCAVDGILSKQPRLLESARGLVLRDWRETANGRRALGLVATCDQLIEPS